MSRSASFGDALVEKSTDFKTVLKYNHNHGAGGKFSSARGGGTTGDMSKLSNAQIDTAINAHAAALKENPGSKAISDSMGKFAAEKARRANAGKSNLSVHGTTAAEDRNINKHLNRIQSMHPNIKEKHRDKLFAGAAGHLGQVKKNPNNKVADHKIVSAKSIGHAERSSLGSRKGSVRSLNQMDSNGDGLYSVIQFK